MRIRFRFGKTGKVRWTSHRDVARMWERALRRVRLPVAYTSGFSPRPRISFGLALPTGAESGCEYLDVELAAGGPPGTGDVELAAGGPPGADAAVGSTIAVGAVDVEGLPALLTPALPAGVDVLAAAIVDGRAGSLQHEVTSCTWEMEVGGAGRSELSRAVQRAMASDSLVVTRERKGHVVTDDVLPAILHVAVAEPAAGGAELAASRTVLVAELATQPRGLRPSELLAALGGDQLDAVAVRRTHQWIERDGARWEPLPLGAPDAPRPIRQPGLERAS